MLYIVVLLILILDQLSKALVAKNLSLNQSLPVIKEILHITLVHNRGAAFGILKNQLPIFIPTALFAVALIYFNLKKHKPCGSAQGQKGLRGITLYSLSLSFILAGALGNLIDRLSFGYVIDFLDIRIWPVFNIADSAITIGAVLLGYSVLRTNKRKAKI